MPAVRAVLRFAMTVMLPCAALHPASGAAQGTSAYPARPLRMVVPFPPGGGTDIVGRLLGQHLSESLGQPVVVDNRPGAGAIVGTEYVARATPDGYTLLMAVASHAINPSVYRKLPYDTLRDFTPVTLAVAFPFVFVVHPSVQATTVKDLIALARAQPGKLTFASSGIGLSNHLAGELFKSMAGIDIVHVPYRGGGPALNDLLGGHVSMLFGTVLETLPQVHAGKLRALAVSSAKRAEFAVDLPTVAEAGLPGYAATGWYAVLLPAAVPAPLVTRLNAEITRILHLPSVKERLVGLGAEPAPTTPEQAREFIAAEVARWAKVVVQTGLRPQ
jgi:tripartite-type tricarboxylate transporter receptor subunit TctC